MKKISVLIVLCFIANLIFAQTGQPAAVGDNYKKMTIAEANALNGTAQPTINGKPYSQYKAEQDALKLQKQQQPSAVPSTIASVTFSPTNNVDKPVINNFSKQSSANGAIEDDGKTDVLKAAIEKAKSAKDVQETAGKKLPEVNNIEVIPAEIITPANIKLEPQTMNMFFLLKQQKLIK